jgi:hypothetical protein
MLRIAFFLWVDFLSAAGMLRKHRRKEHAEFISFNAELSGAVGAFARDPKASDCIHTGNSPQMQFITRIWYLIIQVCCMLVF